MNTHQPLVSIAMPFYNCRETLAPALISVIRQTYPNWELLLCDDGSTDGSLDCARSFQDARIAVSTDPRRRGLAALLNQCIDRARGEYIARMDADDIAYPGRIERQVRFLEEHRDIDLAGSQMLIFAEDGAPLGKRALPCDHQDIVANPAVSFGIGHPTWMGRASWFRRYRYNPRAIRYEDAELLYRSYRESRFANLPEILHAYREPHAGLAKRLKTRFERVRFLWKSHNEFARRSALAELVKAVMDAAIVGSGLRYAMLRSREQRLDEDEIARWRALWNEYLKEGVANRCAS